MYKSTLNIALYILICYASTIQLFYSIMSEKFEIMWVDYKGIKYYYRCLVIQHLHTLCSLKYSKAHKRYYDEDITHTQKGKLYIS